MFLMNDTREQNDVGHDADSQGESEINEKIERARQSFEKVAGHLTSDLFVVILLDTRIEKDEERIEDEWIDEREEDGEIMQENAMTRDEGVMENEKIPLNGGVGEEHENDNIERVVDETPETAEEIGREPDQTSTKVNQNQG